MRINLQKFEQLLAEQGKAASSLRGVLAPATITRIRQGHEVSTRTVGKLAQALGVAPHMLQDGPGVVINRVILMAKMAAQLLDERQLCELSGVNASDMTAVSNDRAVPLSTAWRISDALGAPLEEIL